MQAQNVKWLHMDFPANREKKINNFLFYLCISSRTDCMAKNRFLL